MSEIPNAEGDSMSDQRVQRAVTRPATLDLLPWERRDPSSHTSDFQHPLQEQESYMNTLNVVIDSGGEHPTTLRFPADASARFVDGMLTITDQDKAIVGQFLRERVIGWHRS